jgi:hypothetical protein
MNVVIYLMIMIAVLQVLNFVLLMCYACYRFNGTDGRFRDIEMHLSKIVSRLKVLYEMAHKTEIGSKTSEEVSKDVCNWKYDPEYSKVAGHLSFSTEHDYFSVCYNQRTLKYRFCPWCGKEIHQISPALEES